MNEIKLFIYQNYDGDIKAHKVLVIQSDDKHFGAMHEKAGFLIFRHSGVLEYVDTAEGLEDRLKYHQENPPPAKPQSEGPPQRRNRARSAEICFTGFSKAIKTELIQLAERAGYYIATGATNNLRFLVCGPKAGPSKVAKASAKDIPIITEQEFRHIIRTEYT